MKMQQNARKWANLANKVGNLLTESQMMRLYNSLNKDLKTLDRPARRGDIVIVGRHCSEGIQPGVHDHGLYEVEEVLTPTKTGADRISVHLRTNPADRHTISAGRFSWVIVSEESIKAAERVRDEALRMTVGNAKKRQAAEEEEAKTRKIREEARKEVESLCKNLSRKDLRKVYFVPLAIAELAARQAGQCREFCAANRISEAKKTGRRLDEIGRDWRRFVSNSLDFRHMRMVEGAVDKILSSHFMRKNLQLVYFALSNEYNRQYPEAPHPELRILASMADMYLELERMNVEEANALTKGLPGVEEAHSLRVCTQLSGIVGEYLGEYRLKPSKEAEKCVRVLREGIARLDFPELDRMEDESAEVVGVKGIIQ